ncbi:MAG: glycosyltransferase family 4 protein [Candidatus Aminicenantes bacterium]|nr:MAG: glycosyltransferase family 4 protein [Candidatus Aminicenantes bacterium]
MKKRSSVFFIKQGDCIKEYKAIYENGDYMLYDGQVSYFKQIVDLLRDKKDYRFSVLTVGRRNAHYSPEENLDLKVIDQYSKKKVTNILKILRNQFILFRCFVKTNPKRIIFITNLYYLVTTMLYAFLFRKKIHLFLAGYIEKHTYMNRLIVLGERLFEGIYSRIEGNIQILEKLGCSKKCELYFPKYEEVSETQLVPTVIRKDPNFRVLFIGRLAFVKGVDRLIEIISKTTDKEISFYIIGEGPYLNELNELQKRESTNNLHMLGFMSNQDIYSYIKDADLGIMPSRSEGLGKVALEFMLMETPIVASDVGGIPEIIEDGINGLLANPEDIEGFVDKMELLKNDKDLYSRLVKGTGATKKKILNFEKTFLFHLENNIRSQKR